MTNEFNDSECSALKHHHKTKEQCQMYNSFYVRKATYVCQIILKSFIYSLSELLAFPEENNIIQEI